MVSVIMAVAAISSTALRTQSKSPSIDLICVDTSKYSNAQKTNQEFYFNSRTDNIFY